MPCRARYLTILLCLSFSLAKGQYFPGYYPLDQKLLPGLKNELKTTPAGPEKVQTLLRIASLYLYCPTPRYDSVLHYLDLARPLALELNDRQGFQEQVLLRANVHLNNKEFPEAKKLIGLTTDSARVKLVMRISDYYWSPVAQLADVKDLPLLDSAIRYSDWAFNLAAKLQRNDYLQQAAERIWYVAFLYTKLGEHQRSRQVFADFITRHGTTPGYSASAMYMEMAGTAQYRSDFSEAIRYCILAQQKVTDSPYDRYKIFLQLGQIYAAVKDWSKSIDAYKSALNSGPPVVTNQESDTWTLVNRVVRYENMLGRVNESKQFFKESTQRFPITARQDSLYYFATLGELCRVDKKFEAAEKHFLKALSLIGIYNADMTAQEMYLNIVKLYTEFGRYDKADQYVGLLRKQHRYQRNEYWSGIHLLEYKIDSARGRYLPAIASYLLSRRIADSLKSKSQMAEFQNLEVKYETEKKEATLALREKDIRLLKTELNQQSLLRNVIVVVVGLLAIIAALFFRQFWIKQKSERMIAQKNVLLEALVEEKNWLLKEMHHRVKNNLQTIVSLLESQSAYLKNSEALSAIQQSQHRIHAMSLIHQKLYRGDQMNSIDLAEYLPELIRHLEESFDIRRRIRFQLDVERIELDVSKVIPVGLIVNEAVTNAIKYAFTASEGDQVIGLMVREDQDRKITLTVTDNGSGLPSDMDTSGLGIRLMEGLTSDINGTFAIQSNNASYLSTGTLNRDDQDFSVPGRNHGVTVTIVFQAEQLVNQDDQLKKRAVSVVPEHVQEVSAISSVER